MSTVITATLPNGATETLTVDAVLTETFGDKATITQHPVEQGSNIADATRPEAESLHLELVVSNTPLSATAGVGPPVAPNYSRAENAFYVLNDWRISGALLSIPTTLGLRTRMAIEDLRLVRDAKTGGPPPSGTSRGTGGARISLSVVQIRIVQNKLTQITVSTDPRVANTTKTGSQATPAVNTEPQSMANRLNTIAGGPLNALAKAVNGLQAGQ